MKSDKKPQLTIRQTPEIKEMIENLKEYLGIDTGSQAVLKAAREYILMKEEIEKLIKEGNRLREELSSKERSINNFVLAFENLKLK